MPRFDLFPAIYPEMSNPKKNLVYGAAPRDAVLLAAKTLRQFPRFFSSAGSARTHSTALGWQAMPILEHVIPPASRWQVTQRSVHSTHPGNCAWTAGSFGGTGDLSGASGTMSAEGNVCPPVRSTPCGGASPALAEVAAANAMTAIAMTLSAMACRHEARRFQLHGMTHPKA